MEIDAKERPSYVRFERVAIEDKVQSRVQGRYIAKDIDQISISPPGDPKSVFKSEAGAWLERQKENVKSGRIPQAWLDHYQKSYDYWKKGQEMPLNGVPIRGWGIISPAQQEMIIRCNILTVEDLSRSNEETLRRLGMGAVDLKHKAKAWLDQLDDKGIVTREVADLKKENQMLKDNLESLQAQINALMSESRETVKVTVTDIPELAATEERNDLSEQYKVLFGKAPHHLMKTETIKRRIEEKR